MESINRFRCVLFVILASLLCSCQAYNVYVGGRDGWVLNPSETLNHWAERSRFRVNDTLVFKYKKGSDSVLVVSKEDYFKCHTSNPIKSMDDGDSMFNLDRSGPFHFISGNPCSCEKGQRLIIVVLAVRHHVPAQHMPPPSHSPPGAPSGVHQAPAPAPSSSPAFTSSTIALISGVLSLLVTVLAFGY